MGLTKVARLQSVNSLHVGCVSLRKMSSISNELKDFAKNGRKIIGAAVNYVDPKIKKPDAPILFLKPSSSYITEGQPIVIPTVLSNVVHEIELGVVIGKTCQNVSVEEATEYIGGYCLGLDLTARCELGPARQKGLPWSLGKGFDTANPVSRFISKDEISDCHNVDLWLRVNGELRQQGNTRDLWYNVPELISFISKYMTLEPNDLIMTGTPEGAAKIQQGDVLEAGLGNNVVTIKFTVK